MNIPTPTPHLPKKIFYPVDNTQHNTHCCNRIRCEPWPHCPRLPQAAEDVTARRRATRNNLHRHLTLGPQTPQPHTRRWHRRAGGTGTRSRRRCWCWATSGSILRSGGCSRRRCRRGGCLERAVFADGKGYSGCRNAETIPFRVSYECVHTLLHTVGAVSLFSTGRLQ